MDASDTPDNRERARCQAACVLVVLLALTLAVLLGCLLFMDGPHRRQAAKASKEIRKNISKYVNSEANPCANFYNYVCGNWEGQYTEAEDVLESAEQIMANVTNKWFEKAPLPSPTQTRSLGKAWSALQLCHDVYQSRRDDLDVAREYLKDMGLTTRSRATADLPLLDILVNLSLRHNLPVTVTISPKYDLRSTIKNSSRMVLTVYHEGPALRNWFLVSRHHPRYILCKSVQLGL